MKNKGEKRKQRQYRNATSAEIKRKPYIWRREKKLKPKWHQRAAGENERRNSAAAAMKMAWRIKREENNIKSNRKLI
jgi:hypothetical protein